MTVAVYVPSLHDPPSYFAALSMRAASNSALARAVNMVVMIFMCVVSGLGEGSRVANVDGERSLSGEQQRNSKKRCEGFRPGHTETMRPRLARCKKKLSSLLIDALDASS